VPGVPARDLGGSLGLELMLQLFKLPNNVGLVDDRLLLLIGPIVGGDLLDVRRSYKVGATTIRKTPLILLLLLLLLITNLLHWKTNYF